MFSNADSWWTYCSSVIPEGEVDLRTLETEVVRVHGGRLTREVPRLVRVTIVHIIRNAKLCEDAWMISRIIKTFLLDGGHLRFKAISDGSFPNLHREGRCEILAPQDTEHVNVPKTVPGTSQLGITSESLQ